MQYEESELSRPTDRNAFELGKVSHQLGIAMAATQRQVNPSEQVGSLRLSGFMCSQYKSSAGHLQCILHGIVPSIEPGKLGTRNWDGASRVATSHLTGAAQFWAEL